MSETNIEVTYHTSIIGPPSWWRHPFRRRRWNKMIDQHNENMKDPLFRKIVEEEERAMLFGTSKRISSDPQ